MKSLDAHLENTRIYDANVLEAEHRSLQDMEHERGSYDEKPGGDSALYPDADPDVFIDDCLGYSDDDDVPQPPPRRPWVRPADWMPHKANWPGYSEPKPWSTSPAEHKQRRPPPPPPPSGGVRNFGIGPFVPETQPFDNVDGDTFIDDGDEEDDPSAFVVNGDLGPELSPTVIPPDGVVSDAPAAGVAPEHLPTLTAPVPTPTPSVIHICDTPGCRRRPESDPATRVRLPGLRSKSIKGRPIDDPFVCHLFATEHSNQCHNHPLLATPIATPLQCGRPERSDLFVELLLPYFPVQKRFGFPRTPFQCINRDRVTPPVEMHPFGTVARSWDHVNVLAKRFDSLPVK